MDIRSVIGTLIPNQVRRVESAQKELKSASTTDRDGNGQASQGGQGEHHPPMSDEQMKKALDHLKGLPVVKDNHLELELAEISGRRFVLLKEPGGKLIRRIPEAELWTLQVVKENEKGQLLSKSA